MYFLLSIPPKEVRPYILQTTPIIILFAFLPRLLHTIHFSLYLPHLLTVFSVLPCS